MDSYRCRACGCAYGSHSDEDGHCRTRRARWDDEARAFVDEIPCLCPGYNGPIPILPTPTDCPHEALPSDPHHCLHCKAKIPERASQ